MIIKVLVNDNSENKEYKCEHGLSIYIETEKHKILFDLGQSDLFLENAKKSNVDISDIDIVIISHGHYDHGGGIRSFLESNSKAKIYIHEKAFSKLYSLKDNNERYIGLDEDLKNNERLFFTSKQIKIDEELLLFSDVKNSANISYSNNRLIIKRDNGFENDLYEHEQSLIITEKDKKVLFVGCAHKGIENIVYRANESKDRPMNYVIGGFHLHDKSKEIVSQLAKVLLKIDSKYYTCHCTGSEAYRVLKDIMKDNIDYLSTGNVINI